MSYSDRILYLVAAVAVLSAVKAFGLAYRFGSIVGSFIAAEAFRLQAVRAALTGRLD